MSKPPAVFSPWMRRLDPLLAAEDTNPVFDAYILRSRRLGRPRLRCRVVLRTLVPVVQVITPVLVALHITDFMRISSAVLVCCIVFPVLLSAHGPFRILLRPPLKDSIRAVALSKNGITHLTELWLCGVKGGEIMEAIYLEGAALSRPQALLLSAILPTAMFAGGGWAVGLSTGWLVAVVACTILCSTQLAPSLIAGLACEDVEMRQVMKHWAPEGMEMASVPGDRNAAMPVGATAIATCVAVFLGWRLLTFGIHLLAIGVCVGLIVGAISLRATRERTICQSYETLRILFRRSDVAFESYMRRVMEGSR